MYKFIDFIRVILIPDIIGAVFTLAFLGVTGVLKPYFTIYIKHMFNTRLSDNSSIINKTGNIQLLESDIMSFNKILLMMIIEKLNDISMKHVYSHGNML